MNGRRVQTDQVLGSLLVLLAAAVAVEARTFTVDFLTDPLGARALPLFVAGLLAVGGVAIALRREPEPDWPAGKVWRSIALSCLSFLAYAALLGPLGFVLSTLGEVFLLALIFGGPPVRSLAGAAMFTVVLYLLFGHVLGLSLPMGSLFRVG
jgi:putative tricarboxylic transport membrane protein